MMKLACRVGCIAEFITMFIWLVKIVSKKQEEFSKKCISSIVNCFRSRKVMRKSSGASSEVVVSIVDQFMNLALKSPVIRVKYVFTAYIY